MQLAAWLSVFCFVLTACDRTPEDLREWKPSDHHHTSEAQPGTQVPAGASSPLPMGLTEVSLMAWRNNCVSCHGPMGRGDGPQGPMVKARDLSDPAWQGTATDAQIAESIVKGRGRMPAFSLPTSTVEELVRLVRLIGRARGAPPPSSASSAPNAPSPPASASP